MTREFIDTINPRLNEKKMLLSLFATTPEGILSDEIQAKARHFSPVTHMTADDPPTLFIVNEHGPRPESPSVNWGTHHPMFAEHGKKRLDELGVEAKLVLLKGKMDGKLDRILGEEVAFLKKHLKIRAPKDYTD